MPGRLTMGLRVDSGGTVARRGLTHMRGRTAIAGAARAVSATGVNGDADFVEVMPEGCTDTPRRIHLGGDATCATFNTSP